MGSSTQQRVLFSDIDGTLVHYMKEYAGSCGVSAEADSQGLHRFSVKGRAASTSAVPLPLSSTGLRGWISLRTFGYIQAVRAANIPFVLISGARTSTILQRLPWLPAASAVVTENGGRIFLADAPWASACPLREDLNWRARHASVAGPASQEGTQPEMRQGPLWDVYRDFVQAGFALDAKSYSTCFRVSPGSCTAEQLSDALARLPEGLTSTYNLGKADVYPVSSGKASAAKYLMQLYNARSDNCGFLCDDDNDIALALSVGRVWLPSVSSDSIKDVAEQNADRFCIATEPALLGTEQVLEQLCRDWHIQYAKVAVLA